MNPAQRRARRSDRIAPPVPRRDQGSALILVLVLVVVGSLVTLPLMSYAVTVLRSNQVLSERTARIEAVKAGFRHAMAEPQGLYETCGTAGLNVGRPLPSPDLDIGTETECFLLDVATAQEAIDLPWSLSTTYVGFTVPVGAGVVGEPYPGSGDPDPEAWLSQATTLSEFEQVWLPNLPVHAVNLRSSTAYEMPTGYSLNGYAQCAVYFPGTYRQPVVVDRATYFTSGVYYFESEVRFVGGADAVAGSGSELGCVDDQYAAFYATNAPATHNISGLGATFVLGGQGRIVIDDTVGDVSLRLNQRYVSNGDTGGQPSQRVSVMTVNGDLDDALAVADFERSGTGLEIVDRLIVPLSLVGSVTPRDAPEEEYRPSTLTPEPRPPSAPQNVTATAYDHAAVVSWDAPSSDGGSPITQYTVTSGGGNHTCIAIDQLSCAVLGLANDNSYQFSVVATNELGDSQTSPFSPYVSPRWWRDSLVPPGPPTAVGIELDLAVPVPGVSRYSGGFAVTWTAPAWDGRAPIFSYEVVVSDGIDNWFCSTTGATMCVVTGLPDPGAASPLYDVSVSARNVVGTSPATVLNGQSLPIAPVGEQYVAPEPLPLPPFHPDPVLDITTTGGHAVTVMIPGYVAVPQGVVRVSVADPDTASVKLQGGVLAAWIDLADPRPSDLVVGLLNPTIQRIIRIVTHTTDGSSVTSDAVVQINENEGWAVNSWEVQPG